jgi:hypothetical protein
MKSVDMGFAMLVAVIPSTMRAQALPKAAGA